ncbi:heat shock 70 kDa protein 1-like [Styela clava]
MPAIGIDLGTTNSCVAAYRNDRVEIIANDLGHRITPSFVSFNDDERLVGHAAKEEASSNFENTLFQIKRLIGRPYDDPVVQSDKELWGFEVVNKNNKPTISIKYKGQRKMFCPEEISAMVLESLKQTAEDFLGETVTDAVITVPAYFNDAQRSATRDAGKIAGLNVIRMINEPTAAALAYGLDKESEGAQKVLIFDLGGGTFDVTVLTIDGRIFDVHATGGDTHLGGDDFDNRMVEFFVAEFKRMNEDCHFSLSSNKRGMNRLRIACEAAKRKLSVSTKAKIHIDGLHDGIDFASNISRAKFEELNYDFFAKTMQTVEDVLSDANMDKEEIDNVVVVGGSTRIPKIRELLEDFFNGKKISKTINPDEAVAYGAAALAANLSSGSQKEIKEFTLRDVAPLSLGYKNSRGDMVTVIKGNTKIPTEEWDSAKTAHDYQTVATIEIFEGERAATKDNNRLGSFDVNDIPSALRGVEEFSICFSIDASGILTVKASNKSTGKSNQISISNDRGRLSAKEVSKMVADAERFRKEDAAWKEGSRARNALENFVYSVKHSVEQMEEGSVINSDDKKCVVDKCAEILAWIDLNENPKKEDSERKQQELETLFQPKLAMMPE